MLIPVGYANAALRFSISGDSELMQTAIGLDIQAAGGDIGAIAAKVSNGFNTFLAGRQSTDSTFVEVEMTVGQDGGDPIVSVFPVGTSGDLAQFPLPPNTAVLVRKVTAFGGRRNRGRMYIPGFGLTGDVEPNGEMGSGAWSLINEGVNDWFADLNDAGTPGPLPPVLFHQEAPATPTDIVQLDTQVKVATQRRRLRP